jgi:Protein of unknown function (DUF935)
MAKAKKSAPIPHNRIGVNTTVTPGDNQTVYQDDPITGGDKELVTYRITQSQVIRTNQDISTWRSALIAAGSVITPNRTRLYDIYHDVVLDAHLAGIMQKRVDTVLNKPIFYYDKDGSPVENMMPLIRSYEFRRVMSWIMDTKFWGVTGIEFVPGKQLHARLINRKHIKTKTQKIALTQNDQEAGIDYTRLDNVWVLGEPEDLGILLKCSPYVLYKRGAFADWANFVEVFGMPIRVVKYDPTDPITEAKLRSEMEDDGNLLALMIPRTAEYEIMDGKTTNANGDLQKQFVATIDEQLSIVILGNTETTGNGKTGSQAKSKIHQEQQNEIAKADIFFMNAMLNDPHFLAILDSYGWPLVEGGYFEIKRDLDISFLSERIVIDETLKQMGLPYDDDSLYETYDVSKPKDYEAQKKKMETAPAALPAAQPATARPAPIAKPAGPAKPQPEDLADDTPVTMADLKKVLGDFFGQAL